MNDASWAMFSAREKSFNLHRKGQWEGNAVPAFATGREFAVVAGEGIGYGGEIF